MRTTSPTTTTAGERMPRSAACAAIVARVPTVTRWRGAEAVLDDRDRAVGAAFAAGEGDRRVGERADAHQQHDGVVAAAAELRDLVVPGDDGEGGREHRGG